MWKKTHQVCLELESICSTGEGKWKNLERFADEFNQHI